MFNRVNRMHDDAIIQQVRARLYAEFREDLAGVLATGSRVRGEGDATSDIDLHVVIASARRQRRNIVVDGVEVEMFINPPFQIRRYMDDDRQQGRGSEQHMFVTGRIIYDPHGIVAGLVADARAQWEAGPPPLTTVDHWRYRYGAADMLRDISDVIDTDPERAAYLIGGLLPQIIAMHYRIAGRWSVKPKRTLNNLKTWDPTAANLARQTSVGPVAARASAMETLTEHVLAPLGGPMPLVWATDWEELET